MARSNSYSWMPGWLRKFLNLDDEMPGYGPSTYRAEFDAPPPARPAVTYTPPSASYTPPTPAPRYTPPLTQGTPANETTPRFAASYSPPPPPAATQIPPPPPRTAVSPGAALPPAQLDGYVQPISYGLRSYARGALPPQGLEQFTREFRATLTDVWNLYSYWTRFQTDELVKIGREAMDVVVDNLPGAPAGEGSTSTASVRRIKVTVGNGNGEKKIDRVATTTTIDPPPVPTPAPPPAPPAPTAVFSAPVTADDAEVPPGGRAVEPPAPPPDAPSGPEESTKDE